MELESPRSDDLARVVDVTRIGADGPRQGTEVGHRPVVPEEGAREVGATSADPYNLARVVDRRRAAALVAGQGAQILDRIRRGRRRRDDEDAQEEGQAHDKDLNRDNSAHAGPTGLDAFCSREASGFPHHESPSVADPVGRCRSINCRSTCAHVESGKLLQKTL